MRNKVLLIDDEPEFLDKLGKDFADCDCPSLQLTSSDLEGESDKIRDFSPELAIVDSRFGFSELEGLIIITKLQRIVPEISIVVCSQLADDPATRRWFEIRYDGIPRVKGAIGKNPFPTATQLLSYLE